MRRKLNLPSRKKLADEVIYTRNVAQYVWAILYKALTRLEAAGGGTKQAILDELKGEVDADAQSTTGAADSSVPAAG